MKYDRKKIVFNHARQEFANHAENLRLLDDISCGVVRSRSVLTTMKREEHILRSVRTVEAIRSTLNENQLLFLQLYTKDGCSLTLYQISKIMSVSVKQVKQYENEIIVPYVHEMGWNYAI